MICGALCRFGALGTSATPPRPTPSAEGFSSRPGGAGVRGSADWPTAPTAADWPRHALGTPGALNLNQLRRFGHPSLGGYEGARQPKGAALCAKNID